VTGAERTGEILARALRYPYELPARSYIWSPGRSLEWPAQGVDLAGRRPLLAYGSNAAPEALERKLAGSDAEPLPVERAALAGFDVVYSAHISPYGAVPATLTPSAGTTAAVFVAWVSAEQGAALAATEPNYVKRRLDGTVRTESGVEVSRPDAFLSRHGCLQLDGSEVALAALSARGRRLPALDEPAVLERVRRLLAPELDLGRFVASSLEPALAADRTARMPTVP
jgi:hypothetical protein